MQDPVLCLTFSSLKARWFSSFVQMFSFFPKRLRVTPRSILRDGPLRMAFPFYTRPPGLLMYLPPPISLFFFFSKPAHSSTDQFSFLRKQRPLKNGLPSTFFRLSPGPSSLRFFLLKHPSFTRNSPPRSVVILIFSAGSLFSPCGPDWPLLQPLSFLHCLHRALNSDVLLGTEKDFFFFFLGFFPPTSPFLMQRAPLKIGKFLTPPLGLFPLSP